MAPTAQNLTRVRFRGGNLSGAVLDLPARLADVEPGRLSVTPGGKVYDRRSQRPVSGAEVVEYPDGHPAKTAAKPARKKRGADQ